MLNYNNLWRVQDTAIKINSVSGLVKALNEKLAAASDEQVLFFRGEAKNYGTRLIPKVFRNPFKESERKYYYDMLTNFPQEFESLSNLSRLAKMQHYGCPTRLIDLTSNPLVALYFACCDEQNDDGFFYIIKTRKISDYDSDKALILSCFSHLTKPQQDSIGEFLRAFIENNVEFDKYGGRIIKDYADEKDQTAMKGGIDENSNGAFQFKRLIGEVQRERSAFIEYRTVAKDLFTRLVVRPLIQNDRQKKQEGLFLIFGLPDEHGFWKSSDIEIVSYKIPNEAKERIRKELGLLGINNASLFCDIGSRAKYLDNNID
jgi:hypothetical protein